jgi:two-component system sensor histidine kinase HydH
MPTFIAGYYVEESRLEQIRKTVDENNQMGVSIVDMFYNKAKNEMYCILDAPDQNAIKNFHAKISLMRDLIVMSVESIPTQNRQNMEKFKAIGEISTRLAHDLRNPLSIIKNTVEIMETKHDLQVEERDLCYGRLHRAIDRISHQIEDILDYVRPVQVSFEEHLLNDIIASAVDKITKPDTIKITMPLNPVYLTCDFTKLEIVFTNLITNSIQAMNGSGQIEIKLIDDDKNVSVLVSDTGSGIPQDVLPRIFEPLFTTKQAGTGLGLTSCRQIVEHHYGTIKATSDIGRGTTFTISLPKNKLATLHENEPNLIEIR